jgi:hypothetical protein
MAQHENGQLLVVDRDDPGRLVGYFGRSAILKSRLKEHEEENVREAGWMKQS